MTFSLPPRRWILKSLMTFEGERAQKFYADDASLTHFWGVRLIDWRKISLAARPIRRTIQMLVVTRHHYGISAVFLFSDVISWGNHRGSMAKCRLFSLNVINIISNSILNLTGSQCNDCKTGVMCENLGILKIGLAAEIWRRWRFVICTDRRPYRILLQ